MLHGMGYGMGYESSEDNGMFSGGFFKAVMAAFLNAVGVRFTIALFSGSNANFFEYFGFNNSTGLIGTVVAGMIGLMFAAWVQ